MKKEDLSILELKAIIDYSRDKFSNVYTKYDKDRWMVVNYNAAKLFESKIIEMFNK